MVRFRSAVCLVLTASVAAGLCTGCSRSKFTCSGDNLMGFEGYYYRDGELYVVLDEDNLDYVIDWYIRGPEEWDGRSKIFVYLGSGDDDDVYVVDPDDIDVNSSHGQMLVSFEMDRADVGKITGFYFEVGISGYTLDLEEGTLDIKRQGGDCFEYFSQKYDPLKNEWSEAEYDLVVYGPTEVVE